MVDAGHDPGIHTLPLYVPGRSENQRSVVASGYRRRDFLVRRLLAAGDLVAILLSLAIIELFLGRGHHRLEHLLLGALAIPGWIALFNAYGLYGRDAKRVSHTTVDDLPWLFHAVVIGTLLSWVYFRLLPGGRLDLAQVLTFSILTLGGILGLRAAVRRNVNRILGPERVLLVGQHEPSNLLTKIRRHPEYGLNPVGIVSQASLLKEEPPTEREHDPADGQLGIHLDQLIAQRQIDRLIVSRMDVDEETMLGLLRHSRNLGVKVTILPELFDVMGPSVEVDDVEGITLLGIHPPVLLRSQRALKRALDIVGSGALLALTAPLVALIAVAIKLDSPGPVLFRQERVGKRGQRFHLVKFRTMVRDAEMRRDELLKQSAHPKWLLLEHDPRVTRLGRLLREASLDELPQLWNVLRGEMSLVGPRPLPLSDDRMIEGWGRGRLDLKPGVSGHWQVLGRTSIPFEEMIKLDYLYVTNWTLWTDIRLMLRTLPAVLARRGAN